MNNIKIKTVCFTGHRPEKMPDRGERNSLKTRIIKSMIYSEISAAVDDGFDCFITGMQRGVDLWAGAAVLDIMSRKPVNITAVLPYKGFGEAFTGEDKWIFGRILEAAENTVTICDRYTPDCMRLRNRFMVDNSARIIGVMSSGYERSGTGQTLRYAKSQGLEIRRIDPAALFARVENWETDGNAQLSFNTMPLLTEEGVISESSAEKKGAKAGKATASDISGDSLQLDPTDDDSLELL